MIIINMDHDLSFPSAWHHVQNSFREIFILVVIVSCERVSIVLSLQRDKSCGERHA